MKLLDLKRVADNLVLRAISSSAGVQLNNIAGTLSLLRSDIANTYADLVAKTITMPSAGGTYQSTLTAASSQSASISHSLPPALPTVNGQVLTGTTGGAMQWANPATGTITGVTATAPVLSSGGTAPVISIPTPTANQLLAGPLSGGAAAAAFRALAAGDLPVIGGLTPGAYGNASLTVDTYGRVTAVSAGVAGQVFPPAADLPMGVHKLTGVLDPTLAQDAATKAYVDAHAGVTTVTATSPVLSSGGASPAISLATQAANTFLAGGTSGVPIVPTARALVSADFPTIAGLTAGAYTNTSVTVNTKGVITAAVSGAVGQVFPPSADVPMGGFKLTGLATPIATTDASTKAYVDALGRVTAVTATAPVASTGGSTPVISLNTQAANTFLAGGASGVPIVPTARALVAADLPAVAGVAGAYTNSSVTVDAYGRVSAISAGVAGQVFPPAADLPMGAHKLTGVLDPTLAQDAATKAYVDAHAGVTTVTATSPVLSSGGASPAISLATQAANTFLAGGASGGSIVPTARTIVSADLTSALTTPPPIGGLFTAAGGTFSTLRAAVVIDTSAALTTSSLSYPVGTTITYSTGSTSHAGNIIITTSASIAPQGLGNYLFASAFTNKPGVTISTVGVNSYGMYLSALFSNFFQIANATTIPTSTTITVSYVVIGAFA